MTTLLLLIMLLPEPVARTVVDELKARQFDKLAARFDATMKAALPVEKVQAVWDGLVAQAGPLGKIEKVTVTEKGAVKLVVLTCAFQRSTWDIKVALDKDEKLTGLLISPAALPWSPPPYAEVKRFSERPVTVAGQDGTLTLPVGAGPFPSVVLVHGSGPHDQDETIGPQRPFKDLAWGLASGGVAVLRYQKRTRLSGAYTVKQEAVDDARAAVALLATTPQIDPKKIHVLGHSLGGTLAPRIAEGEPRVAGLIVMAGSTRPIEELLREQIKTTAPGNAAIQAQVEAFAKQANDPKLQPDTMVDLLGAKIPGSYWIDFRAYQPVKTAQGLKIPILVLQGGRDYQVTRADLAGWKKTAATTRLYPTLNHLFMPGSGPPGPAEYLTAGHIEKTVIDDVVSFITR
jgi:uncharacterized protein